MIEQVIADFLRARLDVPVGMEACEGARRYVVVEKTGGGEQAHIFTATLAVQSVSESLYEAARLNERVKAAMREAEALDAVSACQLNTDYNFTDTTTKQYRYQAVYNLVHY